MSVLADSAVIKYSPYPDFGWHEFKITEIRGDWALGDSGWNLVSHIGDCCYLQAYEWHTPNATGWARMTLVINPDGEGVVASEGDAECVALAIKQAGGPKNSFCFQAS